MFFLKQCVHTEGSYSMCKGRRLIGVFRLVRGSLPINFSKKQMQDPDMRLAHNVIPVRLRYTPGRGISLLNFLSNWFVQNFDLRFDSARSRKMCVRVL